MMLVMATDVIVTVEEPAVRFRRPDTPTPIITACYVSYNVLIVNEGRAARGTRSPQASTDARRAGSGAP